MGLHPVAAGVVFCIMTRSIVGYIKSGCAYLLFFFLPVWIFNAGARFLPQLPLLEFPVSCSEALIQSRPLMFLLGWYRKRNLLSQIRLCEPCWRSTVCSQAENNNLGCRFVQKKPCDKSTLQSTGQA